MCIHMQAKKSHNTNAKVPVEQSMSCGSFDGLWKHQNNPACTAKSVRDSTQRRKNIGD